MMISDEKFKKHLAGFDETKLTETSKVALLVGEIGTYVIVQYVAKDNVGFIGEDGLKAILENEDNYFECMSSPVADDSEYKTLDTAMMLCQYITNKYSIESILYIGNEVNFTNVVLNKIINSQAYTLGTDISAIGETYGRDEFE